MYVSRITMYDETFVLVTRNACSVYITAAACLGKLAWPRTPLIFEDSEAGVDPCSGAEGVTSEFS